MSRGIGSAVRISVRGCPIQHTRGVSKEQGGLPQSKPWREGKARKGASRTDAKVGITKTLEKKIRGPKSLRAVYYLMKSLIISFGKQTASQSKAGLFYIGFAQNRASSLFKGLLPVSVWSEPLKVAGLS